jgi:PD-(D/E)XK nuclease family transposase
MPIGIRPINDFAFKKIFGSPENRNVLISLLNAILELPIPIVDITIENPYNLQAGFWGKHWRFTLWNWSGTI